MAIKTINTRIKNRFDTLANWQKDGVTLLSGEIALVSVPTGDSHINPVTGKTEPVTALLMKVGENGADGNPKAFNALPWLSAKAADVYDWAKAQDPSTITIKYNKGTEASPSWQTSTLADVLKDLENTEATVAGLKTNVLGAISIDPATATANGVVQGITYNSSTGKFTVSYGTVATADIANSAVTADKINAGAVITDKIADGAVNNDKIASGVSSDKISIDSSTILTAKLSSMDATIASKAPNHDHDAYVNQNAFSKIAVSGQTAVEADTATDTVTFAGSNVDITTNATNDTITFAVDSASTTTAGITKLGAIGGAATYESIYGSDGKGGINKQVEDNKTDISNLKNAVAGGVHFRGTVTAKPTTASVTVNGSTSITAIAGDVVLWSAEGIEYIYTGSAWEELGDVTRLGDLETKVNNLKTTDTNAVASTHKFVSQVTQSGGQISVTYTQPTSADISHTEDSATTVKATLEAHKAAIASKASSDHTHDSYVNQNAFSNIKVGSSTVAADTATDTVEFAGSNVTITTDAANDKVTFSVADGSTSTKGIVKLNNTTTSTSTSEAATANAVKVAYDLADQAKADAAAAQAAAEHSHPYLPNTTKYAAGATQNGAAVSANKVNAAVKFTNDGTGAVSGTTFDGSAEKTISYNTIGAAASGHTHSAYEASISSIESNYVKFVPDAIGSAKGKLYVGKTDTTNVIIFDCGGAADI